MLNAIVGISLTGLDAAANRLSVAANNISNMNTDGFKAKRAVDVEQPGGLGVRSTVTTPNTPSPSVPAENGRMRTLSNTDVADESVQLMLAQRAYEANLKALKTANDVEKETVNLLG